MIANFFKGIGKGILNILAIPAFVVGLAITSVLGIIVFLFISLKKVILFVTGRRISNELPEDIEAKKIIENYTAPQSKVEVVQAVIQDPKVVEPEFVSMPNPQIDAHREDVPFVTQQTSIQEQPQISQPVFHEIPVQEQKPLDPQKEEKKEEIIETYEPKAAKF